MKPAKVDGKNYTAISWSPLQPKAPSGANYVVIGYVNGDNMIERVETWTEHGVLGDMLVEVTYSNYKDFGGLKVPTKIVQKRGGYTFFDTTIADAKANPPDLAALLDSARSRRWTWRRAGRPRRRCPGWCSGSWCAGGGAGPAWRRAGRSGRSASWRRCSGRTRCWRSRRRRSTGGRPTGGWSPAGAPGAQAGAPVPRVVEVPVHLAELLRHRRSARRRWPKASI